MSSVAEKISRLLALAASPYEAEAQAALLKARQLMAEHKLRPEDIQPEGSQNVIKKGVGIYSTKMSSPWAVNLSAVIAKHYCCRQFILTKKGKKTYEIGFVGIEEDFKVCQMVYRYAFESIMARCGEIKKQRDYPAAMLRQMCNSYGWGFCRGLKAAFEEQTEQHQEWGLVMAVPKPVQEIMDGMKKVTYATPSAKGWHKVYASMGYADGQKFDVSHRLAKTGGENTPDTMAAG